MQFTMNNGIVWDIEQDGKDGEIILTVYNSKKEIEREQIMSSSAFTLMWQDFFSYVKEGEHVLNEYDRQGLDKDLINHK